MRKALLTYMNDNIVHSLFRMTMAMFGAVNILHFCKVPIDNWMAIAIIMCGAILMEIIFFIIWYLPRRHYERSNR